ncbi:MAG TPA: hypothetical protein VLZ03_01985, partial [Thermodesulfobacteriota bacterium]|nr:hypothetical protein [Thermodesulfobacteriota bacterium]
MKKIAPVHGLTFLFLIGLVILTLLFHGRIPRWNALLLRYVILMGLLFALKLSWDRKAMGKAGSFFHYFSPVLFIIVIYESLGDLI